MKCPCQIPGQGSFCAHFHEFSLDDGPGFYCDGDIGQMNQAVLCFSTLLGLVVGGRGCQPLPSGSLACRFLVDRHHCLSNILPGSAKMAQDPQVGRTNTLAIWKSYVAW